MKGHTVMWGTQHHRGSQWNRTIKINKLKKKKKDTERERFLRTSQLYFLHDR